MLKDFLIATKKFSQNVLNLDFNLMWFLYWSLWNLCQKQSNVKVKMWYDYIWMIW